MTIYYGKFAHFYVTPGEAGAYRFGYSVSPDAASKFKSEAAALKAAEYVNNYFYAGKEKTYVIKAEK